MTVLITGAGLVGSQIARLEQEAGRTPVIYDFAPRLDALADVIDLDRCVVVRGDITNPLELVAAVTQHGVRRIVHTAALGGLTIGSNAAPLTSTLVNTMGAAYVLEIARVLELERVVLCSSSSLYLSAQGGEDDGKYGFEEAYPRPNNVYAANKQAAEDLGRAYHHTFGLDVVAVRFAAVFGPWRAGGGGAATMAVDRWLRAAIAGEPVDVDLPGMDWIYSKDAAKGTHLACWAEGIEDRLFNLGMGRVYGADDVAVSIDAAVPGAGAKVSVQVPTNRMFKTSADATGKVMNIERARSQLGFEPAFPMPEAVVDYVAWLREIS